jgi:hypothetical protein
MSILSRLKVSAVLMAAVLAVASSATALQAQEADFIVKANVPFGFETGTGKHYTPGVYTFRVDRSAILIQGKSTSGVAVIRLVNESERTKVGKAVFDKQGDRYFLRSLWAPGDSNHVDFSESKAEKRLEVAATQATTNVQLALLDAAR